MMTVEEMLEAELKEKQSAISSIGLKTIPEPQSEYIKKQIDDKGYCFVCYDNPSDRKSGNTNKIVFLYVFTSYILSEEDDNNKSSLSPKGFNVWDNNLTSYYSSPQEFYCIGDTNFYFSEVFYCFEKTFISRMKLAAKKMVELEKLEKEVGYISLYF